MREVQIIGCVDADGRIARKFVFTKIEVAGLSLDVAIDAHFTMDQDDQQHWVRELTPEVVAYETRHSGAYSDFVVFDAKLEPDQADEHPDFPANKDFREAWVWQDGAVVHDMERARAIHRERMRVARAPRLAELDVAYQRADERGDATGKADVAALKQALRDVTADPAIAAAETPDALKAVWPEILQD